MVVVRMVCIPPQLFCYKATCTKVPFRFTKHVSMKAGFGCSKRNNGERGVLLVRWYMLGGMACNRREWLDTCRVPCIADLVRHGTTASARTHTYYRMGKHGMRSAKASAGRYGTQPRVRATGYKAPNTTAHQRSRIRAELCVFSSLALLDDGGSVALKVASTLALALAFAFAGLLLGFGVPVLGVLPCLRDAVFAHVDPDDDSLVDSSCVEGGG